jgi:hypothetical protein
MLPIIKEFALELASYKGISTEKFNLYYYYEQPGLLRPQSSHASYNPLTTNSLVSPTHIVSREEADHAILTALYVLTNANQQIESIRSGAPGSMTGSDGTLTTPVFSCSGAHPQMPTNARVDLHIRTQIVSSRLTGYA